jgi:hypothetical protein
VFPADALLEFSTGHKSPAPHPLIWWDKAGGQHPLQRSQGNFAAIFILLGSHVLIRPFLPYRRNKHCALDTADADLLGEEFVCPVVDVRISWRAPPMEHLMPGL